MTSPMPTGGRYVGVSLIHARLVGSSEIQSTRTSASPSPISGTACSLSSKVSGPMRPVGRSRRRKRRFRSGMSAPYRTRHWLRHMPRRRRIASQYVAQCDSASARAEAGSVISGEQFLQQLNGLELLAGFGRALGAGQADVERLPLRGHTRGGGGRDPRVDGEKPVLLPRVVFAQRHAILVEQATIAP